MAGRKTHWCRWLIVVAVAIAILYGSAFAQAPRPIEITIGWTPPDITGVFVTATRYFERAAAEANRHGFVMEILTRSPPTHLAFADQLAIIEDFIARRVDLIAISPIEIEVIRPGLARAAEAGIPVIMVNLLEEIEGAEVASYIGFDNSDAASVVAYAMLDYFGGPGVLGAGEKVEVTTEQFIDLAFWEGLYGQLTAEERAAITARGAFIEGVAGGFFSVARLEGFNRVIANYPGIEVLGVCAADWNRAKAVACTEDFLRANPTNLDFIWASSNEMGIGAMLALEAAGRLETVADGMTLGDTQVAVFNHGITPESGSYIAEGRIIAEVTHGFADWGWFTPELAVRLLCGEEIPRIYDIRPRIAYQPNVHLFAPEPVLPTIDWPGLHALCVAAGR